MAEFDPSNIFALFRPVVLPGQPQLSMHRCLPALAQPDGTIQTGKRLLLHTKSPAETARRNVRFLESAFSELTKAHDGGRREKIIIPVSTYSLVGNEPTSLIVSAFRKVNPEIRKSIIVDLFDFSDPLSLSLLEDSLIPLFPFIEIFAAEPKRDIEDFTVFANCNLFAVSIDFDDEEPKPEQEKQLMKFWASATKSRLKLFVQGITSEGVREAAKRYEATGLDGPLIGADLKSLSQTDDDKGPPPES